MMEEISTEIETIKDEIKAEMTASNTDTLHGDDFKVTWKDIISTRFDTTAFKKDHADLYAEYSKTTNSKRFLVV